MVHGNTVYYPIFSAEKGIEYCTIYAINLQQNLEFYYSILQLQSCLRISKVGVLVPFACIFTS